MELSKLKDILNKPVKDMTDIEKWAVFFRYANIQRYRETVNEVIQSKEAMEMAGNLLMSVSQDEKERAVFRSRKMYQTDMQSNWNTVYDKGEKQGRKEGRKEGREEEKRTLIENMLKKGQTPEQISFLTDVPIDVVRSVEKNAL